MESRYMVALGIKRGMKWKRKEKTAAAVIAGGHVCIAEQCEEPAFEGSKRGKRTRNGQDQGDNGRER
jgi:hypothetical protein